MNKFSSFLYISNYKINYLELIINYRINSHVEVCCVSFLCW